MCAARATSARVVAAKPRASMRSQQRLDDALAPALARPAESRVLHFPFQFGFLFSANALGPSTKSWLRTISPIAG